MSSIHATEPAFFQPFDLYLFGQGEHWDIYRFLGAHPFVQNDVPGYRFAVWAPNAHEVYLVSELNQWRWGELPLYQVGLSGIWAAFVPEMPRQTLYKFGIRQQDDRVVYKTDPFAFHVELRPGVASITWDLDSYQWQDVPWMEQRRQQGAPFDMPISVYEVHAGSWRRHQDGQPGFYTYGELADSLIPYVKDNGFTHIQFLPLAEHPLDESWGYQTSHYYAPSSRFGSPEELRAFIDRCHQENLGVILDWVPGHFPKDDWGLGRFDGTALYEHSDPRQGEQPDWGTYVFNYGRHEVRNFLFANALYWLKEFHFDGIRIDAVASMLYLDYSRGNDWIPNRFGGRENLEAVQFLQDLNTVVHGHFPGAMMIAEESTSWPGVSRPVYTGGLGFTFKWNMGWMHDTLSYMHQEPIHRSYHHSSLTFSIAYAFSENFVLPLSHDEVVHGKGALLSKMPGDSWQQQANLRLLFAYQWAHPGKKLLFMGGEFGQWNEWNCMSQLDWTLLDFPAHDGIRLLVSDLNRLLRAEPAMYMGDTDWQGFEWIDFSDGSASVISFLRKAPDARPLLWVFNFTPVVRELYAIGCPSAGIWHEALNSDAAVYGGSNVGNSGAVQARKAGLGQRPYYLELTLPPLAAVCLIPEE